MALKKNQFKQDSINQDLIEDLTIVDQDISPSAQIQQVKIDGLLNILAGKANKSGDTLTGTLTLPTPLLPASLVNKKYIDDNLPGGATTIGIKPNWSISSNTLSLTPYYIITDLGQIQFSAIDSTLPFNSINIENNAAALPNTFYYLYATGTSFVFSTLLPTAYDTHPNNSSWVYLGSLRTNASAVLLPYRKCENHYYYRTTIFSGSGNITLLNNDLSLLVPPTSSIARVSTFHNFSGSQAATMTFRYDSGSTPFATFNFFTQNGSQAGYSYNNPKIYVPLNNTRTFYFSYSGAGSWTGYFLGYVE